jgi:hypothetical protein
VLFCPLDLPRPARVSPQNQLFTSLFVTFHHAPPGI